MIIPDPPIMEELGLAREIEKLTRRKLVVTETHLQLVDEQTDEIAPVRRDGRLLLESLRDLRDRLVGIRHTAEA